MMRNHRNRIRRRYERIKSVNHIPVAIPVRRCSERDFLGIDAFDEGMCVCQVWIWVAAAKVCAGFTVLG